MGSFVQEKSGTRYGFWEVLGFDKIDSHNDARWLCKCTMCGRKVSVKGFTLRNGKSTKCLQCACKERKRQ